MIHLVGVPLNGTSLNPARSLEPALFAGTHAMSHVWLSIVAPLVGGLLAALVVGVFNPPALAYRPQRRTDPTTAKVRAALIECAHVTTTSG